jgi:hypothetical protein
VDYLYVLRDDRRKGYYEFTGHYMIGERNNSGSKIEKLTMYIKESQMIYEIINQIDP